MRFATASDHLTFFHKNHFVEFENLLSKEQVTLLLDSSLNGVEKRLSISSKGFSKLSFEKRFKAGRDLWREDDKLKKITLNSHFAEIAASLTKQSQLRLAYSQFFSQNAPLVDSQPFPFLKNNCSLREFSSFQNTICGLLLQLSAHTHPTEKHQENGDQNEQKKLSMMAERPGNGLFFLPDTPVSFDLFFQTPFCHQYLIVYCIDPAVYRFESNDPNTHFLKQLGCGFGDQLKKPLHPIAYKR